MTVPKVFGDGWPIKPKIIYLICLPDLKGGGGFIGAPKFKGDDEVSVAIYSVTGYSRMIGDGRQWTSNVPAAHDVKVRHIFEGKDWNGAPVGPLIDRLHDMGCDGIPPVDTRP